MPVRTVDKTFTFEQQRVEINEIGVDNGDFSGKIVAQSVANNLVAQTITDCLLELDTELGPIASITAAVIDSFTSTAYSSGKYVVQCTSGAYIQVKEVLIVHDGTDIYIEEYATMTTGGIAQGGLGTITAQFNGANIEVVFTPVYAVNTIKYFRDLITA